MNKEKIDGKIIYDKYTLNKKELINLVLYKQRELEICVDEIERLNAKLEQKDNIIKEVRDTLKEYEYVGEAIRYAPIRECLAILDKENRYE